jgi:hypothetical protein
MVAVSLSAVGFVCLGGCVASGQRTFTVDVLGQKIEVVDNVGLNDQGKTEYKASFDPEAWRWMWAWLEKDDDDETPTETEPGELYEPTD